MAPIHKAAQNGNLNQVKALLNQGVPVNTRDYDRSTPLHNAVISGKLNLVRELLRRGAYVNSHGPHGWTPIHMAAIWNHFNIVKELLKAGANPRYGNMYGTCALNSCIANGMENAMKTSRAATKWQNFRKKSIASRRAPKKNLAEAVFSSKHVGAMTAKYGINWSNKV